MTSESTRAAITMKPDEGGREPAAGRRRQVGLTGPGPRRRHGLGRVRALGRGRRRREGEAGGEGGRGESDIARGAREWVARERVDAAEFFFRTAEGRNGAASRHEID